MASHRRSNTVAMSSRNTSGQRPVVRRRALIVVPAFATAAAGCVLGYAAMNSTLQAHPSAQPERTTAAAPVSSDVQTVGRVVAVETDSITTRSSDGTTMTFRITPATSQVGANPTGFALNQTVTVLGTGSGGRPVATAVVDQTTVGQGGAPMDNDSGA
jgi:Cu/Ag efflux protein CusF